MRPDSSVEANLHGFPGLGGRVEHGPAFLDSMAGGFFHEHMRVRLHGCNCLQGMPVIGGGNDDDLRFFLLEEFAIILVGLWLCA